MVDCINRINSFIPHSAINSAHTPSSLYFSLMVSRSYIESAKLLKGGPIAPCYYFYGPVDLLKDEALALLLERSLEPSLRDLNYDQRSANQLAADDIEALCNTMPMLAERR